MIYFAKKWCELVLKKKKMAIQKKLKKISEKYFAYSKILFIFASLYLIYNFLSTFTKICRQKPQKY